jgi:hypothetical protein
MLLGEYLVLLCKKDGYLDTGSRAPKLVALSDAGQKNAPAFSVLII